MDSFIHDWILTHNVIVCCAFGTEKLHLVPAISQAFDSVMSHYLYLQLILVELEKN